MIILIIIAMLLIIILALYNNLVKARNKVKEAKSGCNGAIAGLLPVTSALGILAFAVALRKKKEE